MAKVVDPDGLFPIRAQAWQINFCWEKSEPVSVAVWSYPCMPRDPDCPDGALSQQCAEGSSNGCPWCIWRWAVRVDELDHRRVVAEDGDRAVGRYTL